MFHVKHHLTILYPEEAKRDKALSKSFSFKWDNIKLLEEKKKIDLANLDRKLNLSIKDYEIDSEKKFLKEKDGLRLIIDPYIVNVSRDMDAKETGEVDNRYIAKYLEELGYYFNENGAQVKWCYCLDINGKTSDELFKEFRSSTRNNINKTITKFKLNTWEPYIIK